MERPLIRRIIALIVMLIFCAESCAWACPDTLNSAPMDDLDEYAVKTVFKLPEKKPVNGKVSVLCHNSTPIYICFVPSEKKYFVEIVDLSEYYQLGKAQKAQLKDMAELALACAQEDSAPDTKIVERYESIGHEGACYRHRSRA